MISFKVIADCSENIKHQFHKQTGANIAIRVQAVENKEIIGEVCFTLHGSVICPEWASVAEGDAPTLDTLIRTGLNFVSSKGMKNYIILQEKSSFCGVDLKEIGYTIGENADIEQFFANKCCK